MNSNVDLIVIGTGAGAGAVAYPCRAAGWSVTVVDSRPFGGTCQLRGCDPKKVLVGGAELVDWNRRMHGHGVFASTDTLDWADLMRFKRTFTDPVPEQNEHSLAEAGIGMLHGRAHFAARAGAHVQIVHRGARPLERFDPDLVGKLVEATRKLGVEVHLNTRVEGLEKQGNRVLVHAATDRDTRSIEADMAVHSAGRVPEIDDLDLEAAGIAREKTGVSVNEYLQSVSNPAVYAAGDAVASGGFPLTPVAGMQGAIVASNLLKGNHRTPDYRGIPSVVFTVPPLASVGLQESAARDQGLRFRTTYQDTADWYSSRRVGMRHSGFKVLVEEETERVLGAHLLGVHAEEVINLFALAIRANLRASNLRHMVYAYPTSSSDVVYML